MQTTAPPTVLGATVELAEQRVDEHWRHTAATRSAQRVLANVVVVVVGRSVVHDRRMVGRRWLLDRRRMIDRRMVDHRCLLDRRPWLLDLRRIVDRRMVDHRRLLDHRCACSRALGILVADNRIQINLVATNGTLQDLQLVPLTPLRQERVCRPRRCNRSGALHRCDWRAITEQETFGPRQPNKKPSTAEIAADGHWDRQSDFGYLRQPRCVTTSRKVPERYVNKVCGFRVLAVYPTPSLPFSKTMFGQMHPNKHAT